MSFGQELADDINIDHLVAFTHDVNGWGMEFYKYISFRSI